VAKERICATQEDEKEEEVPVKSYEQIKEELRSLAEKQSPKKKSKVDYDKQLT